MTASEESRGAWREAAEKTIKTPVPGTFYRAPGLGADRYVNEGDHVHRDQTVGLIEVMKTFIEIKAGDEGAVVRFLVADGDAVDAGQPVAVLSAVP